MQHYCMKMKENKAREKKGNYIVEKGFSENSIRETIQQIPNAKLILYEGYGYGLTEKLLLIQKDTLDFLED